jgi:ubiquinone biosynthesis protein
LSVIRSVYDRTRKFQTAVKDAARFREISAVLVRYGFGHILERMRLRRELKVPTGAGATELLNASFYRRVALMLEALGPTFIKFGQIMSTRPDLIPPELVRELESLQDSVAPLSYADVRAQIQSQLRQPPEALFASFDEQPLASASIAQVHKAVLKTGEQVVVKVQRPGIRRKIDSDINILYFLARQAQDIAPEVRLFDLLGIISEFEQSIQRETNFVVEAQNIERFRKNFGISDDPPTSSEATPHSPKGNAQSPKENARAHSPKGNTTIYIPRVYKEFSTEQVLTMEFIDGRKITQLIGTGQDLAPLARQFLHSAFQMLYVDGFFHGDAHPGNVFVKNDGQLALIDFGMVGRLSQEMREKVIDIIFGLLREDMPSVARTFYELGMPEGRVDYAAFEAECIETLEQEVVGRPLQEIQIGALFRKICEGAIKYRIRMPKDFTMMFKAMVTAEGLAKMIAPEVNVIEEARPHILKMVAERYSLKRLSQEALTELRSFARFAHNAPVAGREILRQIELGELRLNLSIEELEGMRASQVNSSARMQQAVVCAALIVSGTLALPHERYFIHGVPVVPFTLYALALCNGIWLGLSWLRGR